MSLPEIRVTVRPGEPLRRAIGSYRIELTLPAGSTLAALLAHLSHTYPDFARRYAGQDLGHAYPYRLYVNHRQMPFDTAPQYVLADGDLVHIVAPVAGGAESAVVLPAAAIERDWYTRSAVEVGPMLLGCRLVREMEGARRVGRIVEVEAYLGYEDAASHAFRGPTPRNRVMFGPAGIAYVYFIYGNHHCLNVVTGDEGSGQAVLIRAIEPLAGVDLMRQRRGQHDLRALTNGPGKLCQALGIDRTLNGCDLTAGAELWLELGPAPAEPICASPRVGVGGGEDARAVLWRFFLTGNPYVSPSPLNRWGRSVGT